jgi:hypothetical protein
MSEIVRSGCQASRTSVLTSQPRCHEDPISRAPPWRTGGSPGRESSARTSCRKCWPAGRPPVHLQRRLDRCHALLEIGYLSAQHSGVVASLLGGGQAFHCDTPQVVFGEAECPGEAGERGAVTRLVHSVLDLPQRRGGEARSLGEFSLRESPGRHAVVDDRRDVGPVPQCSLQAAVTCVLLTADYRICGVLDSAIKSAKIALQVSFRTASPGRPPVLTAGESSYD